MAGEETIAGDTPASHYDRLGGAPTIREAVERFYTLVLADPDLAPFFTDVDVAQVKRHQVLQRREHRVEVVDAADHSSERVDQLVALVGHATGNMSRTDGLVRNSVE